LFLIHLLWIGRFTQSHVHERRAKSDANEVSQLPTWKNRTQETLERRLTSMESLLFGSVRLSVHPMCLDVLGQGYYTNGLFALQHVDE
jgi:hypothetical protein